MAREAASKATASRGSGVGAKAEAAGEYWSEALKSFLDHIPVSSAPGALQSRGIAACLISLPVSVGVGTIPSIYPATEQLSFVFVLHAAVEIKVDGSVLGALNAMYSSNAAGAVIVDVVQSSFGKYVDRDIGFVEFSSQPTVPFGF